MVGLGEVAQSAQDAVAIDLILARAGTEIDGKWAKIGAALPVGLGPGQFLDDLEPRNSRQRDKAAPIAGSGELGNSSRAANRKQGWHAGCRPRFWIGLDHADDPVTFEGIVHHGEIALLEYVERQFAAREQQGARERKDRKYRRQFIRVAISKVHAHFQSYLLPACLCSRTHI